MPVPGIDKQDDLFSTLIVSGGNAIEETSYCGYCPDKTIESLKGSLSATSVNNTLELNVQFTNNTTKKIIITQLDSQTLTIKAQ